MPKLKILKRGFVAGQLVRVVQNRFGFDEGASLFMHEGTFYRYDEDDRSTCWVFFNTDIGNECIKLNVDDIDHIRNQS